MTVGVALSHINRVLAQILDEQESDLDPESRFAVTWFEQHGTSEGAFGEADLLARAKNVAVNGLVDAGILVSRAGKVRLLERRELDAGWDPATDERITSWEVTQHLVRELEEGGEFAAARLLGRIGGQAEAARELSYRLFTICERNGWPHEARRYNALVVAWPEISQLAPADRGDANNPRGVRWQMTNNERVGKALALLAQGLAPFVDRECGLKYGLDWENAVPGERRDGRRPTSSSCCGR